VNKNIEKYCHHYHYHCAAKQPHSKNWVAYLDSHMAKQALNLVKDIFG